MSAEVKKEIELEIAHVLFIDIVDYSKLSVNEQHARVAELNGIVRLSEQFQKAEAANRILKIPTGDGMALVFYKSPEEPAQCAFEISRALKDNQRLQVRMGIHSGPVSGVVDVNERTNVAGAGINLAQRVMDCGDAGHILLSKHVAEDLEEYEQWRPLLHDLGTFEVKHSVRVSVTNLYSDEVGNPRLPKKLEAVKKHHAHVRWAAVAIGLLLLGAVVAAFMIVSRRPTTSLTAIPEKSIAVLPFVDMSAGKDQEYFSDGISEELLNLLAKIPQLQVTARTSSFAFKGKEIGVPEIARTLHVAHVLEGSVRKAGNSVRITAQLIRAGTDTHLWSQTYDRKLDDIFAIQDEIAADVVKQLKVTLLGATPKARTTDPDAYALYLQAVQLGRPFTAEAFQQSDALYRKVLAIDPRYAPAWYRPARRGNRVVPHRAELEPKQWRRPLPVRRSAAAQGRCKGRAGGDRAGDERDLQDDRPADGLPRTRAQGRLGRRARRADREVPERRALQHCLRLSLPRRGRPGVRVARQGGRLGRRRPRRDRDG